MAQMAANEADYRGYTLTSVEHAPGWRVYIYPGPHLLHTQPDQVSAITKEEALAKARAIIDSQSYGAARVARMLADADFDSVISDNDCQ